MSRSASSAADREKVRRLDGLYIGQLTSDELESFTRCCTDGVARAEYTGLEALLGVGKVRYLGNAE